jgi:hypothetical protein
LNFSIFFVNEMNKNKFRNQIRYEFEFFNFFCERSEQKAYSNSNVFMIIYSTINITLIMDSTTAIISLIILIIIIYLLVSKSNTSTKSDIEKFTGLNGIESPLTTYDDYGTFNFILQIDDLPYYDPEYYNLLWKYKDFKPSLAGKLKCGSRNGFPPKAFDFDKDSFIDFEGIKVRRTLVPENYSKDNQYAPADFGKSQTNLLVKLDRPRASAQPPQPYNIYFGESNEKIF